MKNKGDAGLLIAALVAIVAVVGLVILFTGAKTGAVPSYNANPYLGETGLCGCPDGYTSKFTGRSGSLASCVCHKQPGVGPLY